MTSEEAQTLTPREDTYVPDFTGSGSPIYGTHDTEPHLFVSKKDVAPKKYVAYLAFDIPSPPDNMHLLRAALKLYKIKCVKSPWEPAGRFVASAVLEAWSAAELDGTWMPPFGPPALDEQYPQDGDEDSAIWDVTPAVRSWLDGDPNYGLAVSVEDYRVLHAYCKFWSSESDHGPELVLSYAPSSYLLYLPALANGLSR